jgi:type IV pilus assembly protein PilQ
MNRKHTNFLTGLVLATVFMATAGFGKDAPALGTLKAISGSGSTPGNELVLSIDGKYTYALVPASANCLFVDLRGVRVGELAKTGQWSQGTVSGYRLLQFTGTSGESVVRVQLDMKGTVKPVVRQETSGLRLTFGPSASLASLATSTPVAPAAQSASGPSRTKVSGVSIQEDASGKTFVDIAMNHPATFHLMQLKNPARLVVDFDESVKAVGAKEFTSQSPYLHDVRIAQFKQKDPAVVRVVADLVGKPAFDVHAQNGGVRIELSSRETAIKATRHASVTSTATVPAPLIATRREVPKPVVPVTTHFAKTVTEPKAVATTPVATIPVTTPSPAPAVSHPEYQTTLPASPAQNVAAAPRPVPPAVNPLKVKAERAAELLSSEQVTPAAAIVEPGQAGIQSGTEEKPKYTGENISLNLKDVDLKDFFRLIHAISGLNIIIDPNVTGNVTLVMDDVPWDQALDIVLKNNGLGKQLEGNVLRIARLDTLTQEQETARKLADARVDAMPLVTVFRPINYAKAATVQSLLKSWAGGGALSRRGNVLVDERTNTLIISDIQSQIPIIEAIIAKLDTKAKQVQIQARIVQATTGFIRQLSAALQVGWNNASTVQTGAVGANTTITETLPTPRPVTITPGTNSGFGIYGISNVGRNYVVNAMLAAAETKSLAKTLSSPSIVTQNNVSGMVMQGTQIPIQTSINNTISITYVNATLQLTVTPQVTDDGNIFLIVNVQNATPGAALTQAGPSINTQQATTQVLVPDGGTVVFGGVNVTQRTKSITYVPLLGNIPLLGNLFKQTNIQNNDQELLFFVTPRILPG